MLVKTLTDAIADELNDLEPGNEHVHWPLPNIYSYITQALQQIKLLEPALFSALKTFVLRPGSTQYLPSEYGQLLDIADLTYAEHELTKYFNKSIACYDPYIPKSFSIDDSNNRVFYILPPVPAGSTVTINVFVTQTVTPVVAQNQDLQFPGGDIDKYFNQILDWALFRAFLKDTESQSNYTRAQGHYKSFYDAFGAKNKLEDRESMMRAAKGEDTQ